MQHVRNESALNPFDAHHNIWPRVKHMCTMRTVPIFENADTQTFSRFFFDSTMFHYPVEISDYSD